MLAENTNPDSGNLAKHGSSESDSADSDSDSSDSTSDGSELDDGFSAGFKHKRQGRKRAELEQNKPSGEETIPDWKDLAVMEEEDIEFKNAEYAVGSWPGRGNLSPRTSRQLGKRERR